jgi:hypothetical protein
VRSGPYLLRLCVARKSLADEFLPSFLRDEMGLADLHIGFLTGLTSHDQKDYDHARLGAVFFVDTGQNPDAIPDAFAEFLDRV